MLESTAFPLPDDIPPLVDSPLTTPAAARKIALPVGMGVVRLEKAVLGLQEVGDGRSPSRADFHRGCADRFNRESGRCGG